MSTGSSVSYLNPSRLSRIFEAKKKATYPKESEIGHPSQLKESDTIDGARGHGKDLGRDVGIGHTFIRETTEVKGYGTRLPGVEGDVVLVDTPGFEYDSDDYKILETIANWLEQMGLRKVRFSGILLLHRITDNSARFAVWKYLRSFEKIYESQLFSRVLFVTTMWDGPPYEETFVQRERQLAREYWRDMIDQGARIIRLQKNTHAAALRVIKFLQENRGEPQLEFTPGRVPELISELRGEKKNSEVELA
ncbi:hypothetical protein D9756_009045 [Leucocoprinus leucothites]|uniref:G domain-containing protein n=1 Tax=Leucocoprinus leucothites TaxID=201217 RepID=A0A8H5FUS7_9AGAR|nr:hypothetical protein D9756_009045 [Leucoagaricus leucothites]